MRTKSPVLHCTKPPFKKGGMVRSTRGVVNWKCLHATPFYSPLKGGQVRSVTASLPPLRILWWWFHIVGVIHESPGNAPSQTAVGNGLCAVPIRHNQQKRNGTQAVPYDV